ncbi:concanavalin A-like lectin/glucanase domain-containing protein [Jimgerdemannia flammicorona]|uniref:Concanavalin A-like lectin/glucanase domain-containing protein n=1 Tax=Jimgerdemannia flammicorona TaxID=994334 RepID=A0A433D5Q0_9FUNG|nr:concanavalin A-like lectin/glucanase domain-containing protein [Jimgerdemannia flammicorona]
MWGFRGGASTIRANVPIPLQCVLFYWEVHIISKEVNGKIAIGFCKEDAELDRLPGFTENSWGYHNDNGNSFCLSKGQPYGPMFIAGDTIGCGVNLMDMSAFYTKNGKFLGVAFKDLEPVSLYPCVGIEGWGVKIKANFGMSGSFKFDIEQYEKVQGWVVKIPHPLINSLLAKTATRTEYKHSDFYHQRLVQTGFRTALCCGDRRSCDENSRLRHAKAVARTFFRVRPRG